MSDTAKLIARQFIERVVNTGDLHRVADFVAPAFVDEMKRHITGARSTYPDLQVTVEQQIAEDDLVVSRVTARGTHAGTYQGIRPTNKRIVRQGVNIDRVRDGVIVEHWGAANTFEALAAIDALSHCGPE